MKKTIILIHGVRGTHHGLSAVAQNLSQHYKVITPDLPGSGTRSELKNKTMDGYIEWLHHYIRNLHLSQKPYIIGHSMGSMVVSHYLEKYQDEVQQKVVLMSPVFRPKKNQKFSNFSFLAFNGFIHLIPKKARYKFLGSKAISYCISHYLTCDKTKQKQIDQLHYRYSGRFSSAESITADVGISMREQTIIPPNKDTLLIMGDSDKLTSLPMAHNYAKEDNVSIKIIPKTGHLINYEKPEKVAEIIANYIK
ncbi:alpha/beta hydrolase [Candidatus Saccharibacteria bacterium]|nr:alpha/beta hydrolase [Candidatus Saccharibacteria bacterium]